MATLDSRTRAGSPRPRRPLWLAAAAAAVTFLAILGLWNRGQSDAATTSSPDTPGGLVIESQAAGTSLTAVGRVIGLGQPCTAWLLDLAAEADTAARAVTTGRCVAAPAAGPPLTRKKVTAAHVDFNAFAPLTSAVLPNLVQAPIRQVEWASTDGTDLAVLLLGVSYGELADRGVLPIEPAAPPAPDTEVLVAGVPVAAVAADQRYLRATRCSVGATVEVVEQAWRWPGLRSTDCQGILGGSYGSPAFNLAGQIVAMVSTSSIQAAGGATCSSDGTPCEVRGGNATLVADTTYLTPVEGLDSCLRGDGFASGRNCPVSG